MKTNKLGLAFVLLLASVTAARAEGWHVSAGPAWRSRVKTPVRGAAPVPTVAGGTARSGYDRDPGAGDFDPSAVVERPDPDVPGDTLWAVGASFTETTTTPGDGAARVNATDAHGPLGLKARAGYDVWDAGPVSFALDLRFAGYWNIRSSAAGRAGGGSVATRTGTDWWLFKGGPYPDDRDFTGAPPPERDDRVPTDFAAAATAQLPGRTVRARLEADLYQLGLGPTVTWRICPWLDAYAGAAALCNFAALDFEAGTSRASETACLFGLAAEVGLVANLTENLGAFAEVGYEWIDEGRLSAGGLRAEADFSSLVVSAGLRLSF